MTLRISSVLALLASLSLGAFPCDAVAQNQDFGNWITLFNGIDTGGWVAATPSATATKDKDAEKGIRRGPSKTAH